MVFSPYPHYWRSIAIHHNRFQLHHWLGGYLCYKCIGNLSNLKVSVNQSWMPILPFDRSRVIIELHNKPHLLASILDRIDRIERLHRKYSLALLLTPAENHWLASELNIFVDRALRYQQLYDLAIDEISKPSEEANSVMSIYDY
jgi:DNA repair ATPase RecN